MGIASYEIVGSGGIWRVKHDGEPIGRFPRKPLSRQPLLLLHWPFGKDTRFNFQYPELDSNLDGPPE
jgi:hypothetical protein